MPSDPRPADLTAQDSWEKIARDATATLQHSSYHVPGDHFAERVARLAAPSRGQGAELLMSEARVRDIERGQPANGREAEYLAADWLRLTRSPAPVASPERFKCPECGVGANADEDGCCAACGADCEIVAAPAGPETGERLSDQRVFELICHTWPVAERDFLSTAVKQKEGWLLAREVRDLRSALSAATERANEAEKKRALETKINERLAESIIASESRCAAALKLAGEAVESLYGCEMALAVPPKRPHLSLSLRERLASLSSPSAPESTNGV